MPDRPDPRERAETLRRLHHSDIPLVLPNAWDVPSARVFAAHPRCRALGTTSAGIAATRGYPDGEVMGLDEMVEEIRRIAAAVALPVTADLESGYGAGPVDVAESVTTVIGAGAAGINIEDVDGAGNLFAVAEAAERVGAAREAAGTAGVPIVVNARTDVYWRGIGAPEDRLGHTVERLRAYHSAGADCVFAPGLTDPDTIAELVAALDVPLNVLAGPGLPDVDGLRALGVARLSVGSARPLRDHRDPRPGRRAPRPRHLDPDRTGTPVRRTGRTAPTAPPHALLMTLRFGDTGPKRHESAPGWGGRGRVQGQGRVRNPCPGRR
ncbi:isocitrate lyase/phosphoenolpyruvate mutase family protein [Pseudonocardia nematodicida]|uniref:Isocitrate lyase/phosphoenolpyruvate mutase family protein n=1 Tax=Pseudonocardia nematodicida TaxID=1206997 RepID=A0ABV1KIA2_9PSEU